MGSWSLLESEADSVPFILGVPSVVFDGAKGMAFGVDMITLLPEALGKRFTSVVGS